MSKLVRKSHLYEICKLSLRGFRLLSRPGKIVLSCYSISLALIGILDAAGLALLAHALSEVSESKLGLNNDLLVTLLIVVSLFIFKSILAIYISFLGLKLLAREEVMLGQMALNDIINTNWLKIRRIETSEVYSKVDRSPNTLIQSFLFLNATIVSEAINGILIITLLFIFSPVTAVVTGLYFSLVTIIQHSALSKSASRSGQILAKEFETVYRLLNEFCNFGKVLRVMPSDSLQKSLVDSREFLAQARARSAFLSSIPRYFMEAVLAFGCILIFGIAYLEGGSNAVIPAVAIFTGAGFRLLPVVNRIQSLILVLYSAYPLARSYFSDSIRSQTDDVNCNQTSDSLNDSLVQLKNVGFKYPDSHHLILVDINLDFKLGNSYAIVGNSGSGKTTLAEVIIGLLPPTSGIRSISKNIPVKFGYVTQDVPLLTGTIAQNIAMSWDSTDIDTNLIEEVVAATQLQSVVEDFLLRDKTNSEIGLMLSSGQRQRLGIARALYQQTNCLILDEPSSSLDVGLEHELVEILKVLKPKVTTITISHRLTTIQNADVIIYLENGRVVSMGTFTELTKSSPAFRKMIELSFRQKE